MKKIFILILASIMSLSLCACESKEEKALREAREAARSTAAAYQRAVDELEQFQRDVAPYVK